MNGSLTKINQISSCRSCKKAIVWMKTKNGKNVPVDYQENVLEAEIFNPRTMKAHFTTCPQAASWRKSKQKGER